MPKITENWAKMVIFSETENKTIGAQLDGIRVVAIFVI